MDRNKIIELLEPDWSRMLELIRNTLRSDVPLLEKTNNLILSNTGKLLRPMLSMLMARACGKSNEDSLLYAAASELLHNATLMHDDVADDSTERRGRPSVMSILGPNSAVLVGDFWLARAVEMVLSAKRNNAVVNLFSKTLTDLAEGEMLQLQKATTADTDEEEYYRIIYCKTASLFEAACVSAAISVDGPQQYCEAARGYARNLGIAFQIKDDILDYAGDDSLGKPVGVDIREQKITLPLLGALEGSPREKEIRGMIREIHNHPEYCAEVREFVLEGEGIEYASACLDEYIASAEKALSPLPDTREKEMLVEIARYNAFRKV